MKSDFKTNRNDAMFETEAREIDIAGVTGLLKGAPAGTSMTSLAPLLILDKISRTSYIFVPPIILLLSIPLR